MNRELVERTTHPEALEALLEELAAGEPKWRSHDAGNFGLTLAHCGSAAAAGIDWTKPFTDLVGLPWSGDEETYTTRLGLDSRVVEFDEAEAPIGPFGEQVRQITIPARWTGEIDPAIDEPWRPRKIATEEGAFSFQAWGQRFHYDCRGLRKLPGDEIVK